MAEPRPIDLMHGITLKVMIEHLVERYGWDGLGERITIRCFTHDPSVNFRSIQRDKAHAIVLRSDSVTQQ